MANSQENDSVELDKLEDTVDGNEEGDLRLDPPTGTLSLAKNDRSLSEFHRWHTKGRIIVDPEWQRRYVWDRKRASRLIESFLIELPVPVIYLATNQDNQYEVIDGLQRLTSVFDFFDNKFSLIGLEIRPDLNGHKFSSLPRDIQGKLEDTTLRTFELAQTTFKDLMFIIFERLNTGGVALNEMEIRNCLYRGSLNSLIRDLCTNDDFKRCINQKNIDRRMTDRALVLRFLAFHQLTYKKARKGLKAFFNEFFDTYKNANQDKLREFERVFKGSMKAAYSIFGNHGFRLRRISDQGAGEWLPRSNATVFQVIATSFAEYDHNALIKSGDKISEAYLDLMYTDEKWVEAVSRSTGDFNKIEYTFQTWENRLKEIMKVSESRDRQRLFSKELKAELFKQNPTCSLCSGQIVTIADAALDHDRQYWLGGKTIPENARLAHRQCNNTRPRTDGRQE